MPFLSTAKNHAAIKAHTALAGLLLVVLGCGSGGDHQTTSLPPAVGGAASVTNGSGGAGGRDDTGIMVPTTGGRTTAVTTSGPGGANALPSCPTTPLAFDGSGLTNFRFLNSQGTTVMASAQEDVPPPSGTRPRKATLFELQGDKLVPVATLGGGQVSEGKTTYVIESMIQSALRLRDDSLVVGLGELRYDQANTSYGISYSSLIHSADAATWAMEAGGWEKSGSATSLGQVILLLQISDGRVFALQSAVSGGVVSSVTLSERAATGSWASGYTAAIPSCNANGGYPACTMPHSLVEAADGVLWFTTAQALLGRAPGGATWEPRLAATNLAFGPMARAADNTLWLTGADAYVQGNTKRPRPWVGPWDGTTWGTPIAAPLDQSTGVPADIVLTDQGPLAVFSTPKPNPMAVIERLADSQWVPVCQLAVASPPALLTSLPGKGLFAVGVSGPVRIDLP